MLQVYHLVYHFIRFSEYYRYLSGVWGGASRNRIYGRRANEAK